MSEADMSNATRSFARSVKIELEELADAMLDAGAKSR
jgi:hypothetical protein